MGNRKPDKRGRSKGQLAPFVALERFMLDCAAWSSLNVNARQAYIEVARLYVSGNNGKLALSARMLSDRLHISKMTASRALKDLVERGFIEQVKHGGFNLKTGNKRATEWRLTRFKCDATGELPSKAFMNWKAPEIHFTVSPQARSGITRRTLKPDEGPKSEFVGTTRYRNGVLEVQSGITTGPLIYSSHRQSSQQPRSEAQHGAANQRASADASQLDGPTTFDVETFVMLGSAALKSLQQLDRELPEKQKSWARLPPSTSTTQKLSREAA